MEKRCPACMQPVAEETSCPACGFKLNTENALGMLPVGTVLKNRYTVGILLYHQTACSVYMGYDNDADTKVLLRVCDGRLRQADEMLNRAEVSATGLVQRFLQFSRAMAEVNLCDVLPRTVDIFSEQDRGIAVHTYFDGMSLRELLQNDVKIATNQAFHIAKSLAVAVKALQASGIVFGTISPENVFILKNGEVRLYGLGVSVYGDISNQQTLADCMNPSYAAPELFLNGTVGPAADVYSVAAVLYRILCGVIPPVSFLRTGCDELKNPRKLNKHLSRAKSNAILNGLSFVQSVRTQQISVFMQQLSASKVARRYTPATVYAAFAGKACGLYRDITKRFSKNKSDKQAVAGRPEKSGRTNSGRKKKLWGLWAVFAVLAVVVLVLGVLFLLPKLKKQVDHNTSGTESSWYYGDNSGEEDQNGNGYHDTSSRKPNTSSRRDSNSSGNQEPSLNLVTCPNLVGLTENQALDELFRAGLAVGKVSYQYSDTVAADHIIRQSVKSGLKVEVGKSISITVSKGAEPYTPMPDLNGQAIADAISLLEDSGISYSIKYQAADQPAGTVIKQSVEAGQKVKNSVIITVSGEKITVPEFTGKTLGEVLDSGELTVGLVVTERGETVAVTERDRVIVGQSLKSGSNTFKGDRIDLTVAD